MNDELKDGKDGNFLCYLIYCIVYIGLSYFIVLPCLLRLSGGDTRKRTSTGTK